MKKIVLLPVMLLLLVMLFSACSNSQDSSKESENKSIAETVKNQDKVNNNSDAKDDPDEEVETQSDQAVIKSTDGTVMDTRDSGKVEGGKVNEEEKTESKPSNTNEFDVEDYVNKNYPLEGIQYAFDTWQNDETGRTEYIVKLSSVSQEYDNEINTAFKKDKVYEVTRTKTMMETADKIIEELPQLNDKVHIESVNWVSKYEDNFGITLIQDRAQTTIK